MTSIKLFFILQEHVAAMNSVAMRLKTEVIDKETAKNIALKINEELKDKLNTE